jgi:hypothetical protein
MIKVAAQKPAERKDYILRSLNHYAALGQDPTVAAWQMKVEDKMIEVPPCPSSRLPCMMLARMSVLCTPHAGCCG